MFSDTHFHFHQMVERCGFDGSAELCKMAENNVFFAMDIGTKSNDLAERQECVKKSIDLIQNEELKEKAKKLIYFSAGIWPSPEEIQNRTAAIKMLEQNIKAAMASENPLDKKIAAIGECGLDHHWNPSGVDGRTAEDFDQMMLEGEKEMFMMQIELARKLNLPVIVHSRDAFEDTLECIDKAGYHNGIIHCYSYDKNAAQQFLERGWYIALGGGMTYTKKSKMEEIKDLICSIPESRLLLETDAPYLSPVPLRGTMNTPNNIEHTYRFIAQIRNVSVEYLCGLVDENCRRLFNLTEDSK